MCFACEPLGAKGRPSQATKRTARLLNGKDAEVDLGGAIFGSLARTGEICSTPLPGAPGIKVRYIVVIRLKDGRWLVDGLEANSEDQFRSQILDGGRPRLVEVQAGDALADLGQAELEFPEPDPQHAAGEAMRINSSVADASEPCAANLQLQPDASVEDVIRAMYAQSDKDWKKINQVLQKRGLITKPMCKSAISMIGRGSRPTPARHRRPPDRTGENA